MTFSYNASLYIVVCHNSLKLKKKAVELEETTRF